MHWIDKLQIRWNLKNTTQVILILVVFACTGLTIMFLKAPVINFLFGSEEKSIWFSILYYVLILPVYNLILLFYGLIFGQFSFFWAFEKRMFDRLKRKKNAEKK